MHLTTPLRMAELNVAIEDDVFCNEIDSAMCRTVYYDMPQGSAQERLEYLRSLDYDAYVQMDGNAHMPPRICN